MILIPPKVLVPIKLENDSRIPEDYGDILVGLKTTVQAGFVKDIFLFQDGKRVKINTDDLGTTRNIKIPNKNLEILVTTKNYVKTIDAIVSIYGTFEKEESRSSRNWSSRGNWIHYLISKFF